MLRPIGLIKTGPFKLVRSSPVLEGSSVQSSPKNSKTEVIGPVQKYGERCLYSINWDSLNKAVRLNHPPLNLNATQRTIVGSCNGLLCLIDTENYIFLWNPSTRKYRKSPISRIPLGGVEFVVFGFGYDDVRNDYKVVRMVQFYGKDKNSKNSEVSVYALKSDSLRGIGDFPYDFTYNRVSGVFASGDLYWAVSQNHREELKNLIAAFDLGTKEYRTSLPWLLMPMWLEMRLLILLAFELKDPICRAGHEYGHGFVESA
ncbi:hypothetical protein LguiA_013162 [Lonicera macranthoides]